MSHSTPFFSFLFSLFSPQAPINHDRNAWESGCVFEEYKKNRESWAEREKLEVEEREGEQLWGVTGRSADD